MKMIKIFKIYDFCYRTQESTK